MNNFSDTNWYTLENSVKEGNVIPVIGPDALLVEMTDAAKKKQTMPFYQLVAKGLLESFLIEPLPEILTDTWSLHKAVTAVLANKSGPGIEQRLRREISRLVNFYLDNSEPADSLKSLAKIPAFNLLVSLTPDNLLERAINQTGNTDSVQVNTFSPREASESIAGQAMNRPNERSIFQMLGSCLSVGSGFAIHEEDALEYLYKLQSDSARRFSGILAELRRKDLLFIGCNFPDWLGRAMLRMVNDNRFYAKDTQEFLCPGAKDTGLNTFLTHYSPNTLAFDDPPEAVIAKLVEKFGESVPVTPVQIVQKMPLKGGPTIFVSYASQNTESVRTIADTLLTLGFSDVWLDRKKLKGGDDWSDRIVEAIQKCDFFMPILSIEADNRREGVFWDEWQTAIERSRRIKDAFLLPVGIDLEKPAKDRYHRIADGDTAIFFDKHLIHAPGGTLSNDDCDALRERCQQFVEKADG